MFDALLRLRFNMQLEQMRERCPSVRFVCAVRLKHYRLGFTQVSRNRECGAVDILPNEGGEVRGALFQSNETDIDALDKSEGYWPGRPRAQNAYERTEIPVERDGVADKPVAVWTYEVVTKHDPNPKPAEEYKQLLLDGARMWHVPAPHLQQLRAIQTQ